MNPPGTDKKLVKNELLKAACPTLAGTIAATLADPNADRFSEDDEQFIKFHGLYQQDDRDKRKTGKEYMLMVRNRMPGGAASAAQYLAFDDLAGRYGNATLRITSRQAFQFHGVLKSGLGKLMRGLHDALSTTLAACGDVNRNVMAPPTPATSPLVERVHEDARLLSKALLPITPAYHQIWVDGVELNLTGAAPAKPTLGPDGQPLAAPPPAENDSGPAPDFTDPLYGKTYLPRKFKTAFAIPPLNDTDVYTNCLGFVAVQAEDGSLVGYNLLAGGGLGTSHGNKETYPRLADEIGFFPPEKIVEVAKAVLTVHRDFGDRTNRKHARLKYVLQERGVEWFRAEVEARAGFSLGPVRKVVFTRQGDLFGWHRQTDGRWFLGLYVEAGRIQDKPGYALRKALREVVSEFALEVRLTASQNLLLVNVDDAHRAAITGTLARHGIPVENQTSAVRRASMACPALPTCGLALAESERFLPGLLSQLEVALADYGLQDDEITVRMTGCPNGCARPYMAEIGLIGRAPNKYNLYLGGNGTSTRLNRVYRESVKGEDIVNEVRPVLQRYAQERYPGERFGDFVSRTLWTEPPATA